MFWKMSLLNNNNNNKSKSVIFSCFLAINIQYLEVYYSSL